MSRGGRRVAFALLVTTAALVVAVGLAELALRRRPLPFPDVPPSGDGGATCVQASLTRGWAPLPGACGRDAIGVFRLRGPGTPTRTVLLVGDSVSTHGWVRTAWRGAADRLAPAGLDLSNAAVSGYDACQVAATWAERVEDPELLVVQTCPNDFIVTSTLARLPGGDLRYFGDDATFDLPAWAAGSALALEIGLRWGRARHPAPRPSGRDLGASCTRRMLADADARGVPVLGLVFPTFDGHAPGDEERLQGALFEEAGVPWLAIRDHLPADLLLTRDRVHPDARHDGPLGEVVGAALVERLAATATR